MQEYTGFPEFSRPNPKFSWEIFTKFQNPEFSWISENPEISGKGDLDKKDPKFSIFTGFYTKFCGAYQVYTAS